MQFSVLKEQLGFLINDPDSKFLTAAERATILNQANLEVCLDLRCLWDNDSLDTDGTATISLTTNTTDLLAPIHVFYREKRLRYITFEGLTKRNTRWYTQTGEPEAFYMKGGELGLYPYLTTSVVGAVTLLYIKKPTTMTNDADLPFSGVLRLEPLHQLVLYKAAIRASAKTKDQKRFALFQKMYEDAKTDMSWLVEYPVDGHEEEISVEGVYY
jgi:hypothetical protein